MKYISLKTVVVEKTSAEPVDMTHRMSINELDEILVQEPFSFIVSEQKEFDKKRVNKKKDVDPSCVIKEILFNEAQIEYFDAYDIILNQGDYDHFVYFILDGQVTDIDKVILDRNKSQSKHSWIKKTAVNIIQQFNNSSIIEFRDIKKLKKEFIKTNIKTDAPCKLNTLSIHKLHSSEKETLINGDFFGITSALRRSARQTSVVALRKCKLLKISWQGLHKLRNISALFRTKTDSILPERDLKKYLKSLPLFQNIGDKNLESIIKESVFESFGEYKWKLSDSNCIITKDQYVDGLILITAGFAKVSEERNDTFYTTDYLTTGDVIGIDLLRSNLSKEKLGPNKKSNKNKKPELYDKVNIHSLGYTDTIRIPLHTFKKYINPFYQTSTKQKSTKRPYRKSSGKALKDKPQLLKFFVDHHFINGTQTMLINTERCTGCDDCVRACAKAHNNNPRFIRHGHKVGKFMVANACMHCTDPVCLIDCPTGAIHRHPVKGLIVIDENKCIGCSACESSCPYQNIRMVATRHQDSAILVEENSDLVFKATKCDLCIDQMVSPACEYACPHDALRRVNLHELNNIDDWM